MVTLDEAKALAAAAFADADGHGWPVTVCVVDVRGLVVYQERQDGARAFTSTAAEGKAVASAFTGLDSAVLEELARSNPTGPTLASSARTGGRYVAARGGLPLVRDGDVVGAIGVSGATGDQDAASARAAVDALGLG